MPPNMSTHSRLIDWGIATMSTHNLLLRVWVRDVTGEVSRIIETSITVCAWKQVCGRVQCPQMVHQVDLGRMFQLYRLGTAEVRLSLSVFPSLSLQCQSHVPPGDPLGLSQYWWSCRSLLDIQQISLVDDHLAGSPAEILEHGFLCISCCVSCCVSRVFCNLLWCQVCTQNANADASCWMWFGL